MKSLLLMFAGVVICATLSAQGAPIVPDDQRVRISHRYDFRTRVDGKYTGILYGGALGVWSWDGDGKGRARYFLEQETLKDARTTEKQIDKDVVTDFTWNREGRMTASGPGIVPIFRNFPYAPPDLDWKVGTVWQAAGEVVMDWAGSGTATRIPILCEYTIAGLNNQAEVPYWEIKSLYALRYREGLDPSGDPGIKTIQGRHESVIQWPVGSRLPSFIRIKIDETIGGTAGMKTRSGFWLTWYKGVVPLVRAQETSQIQKLLKDNTLKDVEVSSQEEGIRLILKNLQFVADQAVLLPGEESRLDQLAGILNRVRDRTILVTGHTADIGQNANQDKLSLERAKAVVDALKSRGIRADRLLYLGKGGRFPLGDNGTAEGRAINRRVEITILED